jgi:hypothetical protein
MNGHLDVDLRHYSSTAFYFSAIECLNGHFEFYITQTVRLNSGCVELCLLFSQVSVQKIKSAEILDKHCAILSLVSMLQSL